MKALVSLAALPLLLTASGCTFGTNIDNLMSPPKLSVEQEQIYSALTDAAGSSISLKYPRSGKYLSAFIVEDIDSDGGNEAIVFYEKTGLTMEENTLRMNVLDQDGGKWRSVCDDPIKGAEIEKVIISKLGTNGRVNIIIGCSLINRSEKNVTVYNYSPEERVMLSDFSSACSFIDVTDLDSDGTNEFLLLTSSATGSNAVAEAYQLDEEGKYHQYPCELSGSFTEFDSLRYGKIGGDRQGLYIDAVSGTGSVQTDVIYMSASGLKKVFETPEESLSTIRPSGCLSLDVDGDGILEIPVQTISPGYEEAPESEQMKLTKWQYIDKDNRLEEKCCSYYSVGEGYIFVFPERWKDRVTVKRDVINGGEVVFCAYENGKVGRELLRIYCAEDTPSREDRLLSGYMLLRTRGETSYLAYIPADTGNNSDGLSAAAGDVAVGFMFSE